MVIDGKEYIFRIHEEKYHCAMDVTMGFIGGKWKSIVLWYLIKEPKRFSQLKRHVPGITEKMLSLQLKELEADGLVKREVFAEVPPRVEYSLTEEGKTLIPVLQAIAEWGNYMGRKHGNLVEVKSKAAGKKKVKV